MSQTSAIYHPKDPKRRAVNINGRWQVQRRDTGKGTKTRDPWYAVGKCLDVAPDWSA